MLTPAQLEEFRAFFTASMTAAFDQMIEGFIADPVEPELPEGREYDASGWSLSYIEPGARYSQKIDAIRSEVVAMPSSVARAHLLAHPLLNRAFVCNTPDHLNEQLTPEQNYDRKNNIGVASTRLAWHLYAFKGETDPIKIEDIKIERSLGRRGVISDWRRFGSRVFSQAVDYVPGDHKPGDSFADTILLHQWWRCETDDHIAVAVRRFVDAVIEHGPAVVIDPFAAYSRT